MRLSSKLGCTKILRVFPRCRVADKVLWSLSELNTRNFDGKSAKSSTSLSKLLIIQTLWRRGRDSNLSRFAGVSGAGARRRNPESAAADEGPAIVAEREGFEPPIPFRVCRFSRPEPSTARPPLRGPWAIFDCTSNRATSVNVGTSPGHSLTRKRKSGSARLPLLFCAPTVCLLARRPARLLHRSCAGPR